MGRKLFSVGFLTVSFLAINLASFASADWQGKVVTLIPQSDGSQREIPGTIKMKGHKTRVDLTSPMQLSVVVDLKSKKSFALMHSQKLKMDGDLSQVQQQLPICSVSDIEGCLKKQGFKKTGEETLDMHPCTVYEGEVSHKNKKSKVKLWRPNDLKEVPSIKTVVQGEGGKDTVTTVTDIKSGPLNESEFTAPKDYRSLGNIQQLMKGIPGV